MKFPRRFPFWLAAGCACAALVFVATFVARRKTDGDLLAHAALAALLGILCLLAGIVLACLESKTRVRSLGFELVSAQRIVAARACANPTVHTGES